jgi:hypothetical protein
VTLTDPAPQDLSPIVKEEPVAEAEADNSDRRSRIDKRATSDLGVSVEQIELQYTAEPSREFDDRSVPDFAIKSAPRIESHLGTNERFDVTSDSHDRDTDQPEYLKLIESEQESEPQQTQRRTVTPIEVPTDSSTLKDYLSEVRRWLVSKPEDSANESDQERRLETEDTQFAPTLAEKVNPSWTSSSDHSHELEQNDLNLSIDSINIVIEEPASAVALPQVSPVVPRGTHETERKPTSLSRYYLRSW